MNDKEEHVHRQFIRFGKGIYEGRAVLFLQRTTKIKLRGSFEWANDFVELVSELNSEALFSGVVSSKENIQELNSFPVKKKQGILQYEVSNLQSSVIKSIKDRIYFMLLDSQSGNDGINLKIKRKLPKPGKSGEGKADDKFCQLEADLKHWMKISESFMLPECKKAKVSHTYIIEEILIPKESGKEKDFSKIREMAKRKGKIVRKMEIDKKEAKEEREFTA